MVREASIGPSSWNGVSYDEVVDLLEGGLSSERTIRMPAAVPSARAVPIAAPSPRRAPTVPRPRTRPAPAKRSSRGFAFALLVGLAVVATGVGVHPSLRRVAVHSVQDARVRASAWVAPIAERAAARFAAKPVETAAAPPPPVVEDPASAPIVTTPALAPEPVSSATASATKKPRAGRGAAEIDPASLLDDGLAPGKPSPKAPSIDPASLLDHGLAPP